MFLHLYVSNGEVGYTAGMPSPSAGPVHPREPSCLDSELLIMCREPSLVPGLRTRWERGFHHSPVIKGKC